jgi:hypothetical protein
MNLKELRAEQCFITIPATPDIRDQLVRNHVRNNIMLPISMHATTEHHAIDSDPAPLVGQ